MVIATTSSTVTKRLNLTSLPDAFVEARRLTYGEKIRRRAMTSYMEMNFGNNQKDEEIRAGMQTASEEATRFDFAHCIVDHNLEEELPPLQVVQGDTDGPPAPRVRKLDLSNKNDLAKLDPRVGEEIETFLDSLNNFEVEEGN